MEKASKSKEHSALGTPKGYPQNLTQKAKEAFEKIAKHVKSAAGNHKVVSAYHKKNLEALKDAHTKRAEMMKSVTTLHGQVVKQTFADLNAMVRGMMTKKPDHYFRHVETMQNSFHRSVDQAKFVKGILVNSHHNTPSKVHERIKEAKEIE